AVQAPLWQTSLLVQALPSLHGVPLGAAGLEQVPVAGSQVPAVWQASTAVQVTGVPGMQAPAWQTSAPLHAFMSLHEVPLATGVCEQVPLASQASAVQGLASSQVGPVPGGRVPVLQAPPTAQAVGLWEGLRSVTGVCSQHEVAA